MPSAQTSSLSLLCASFTAAPLLLFVPCLAHTPPCTATFVHPSLLNRLTFAPCLLHNPPSRELVVHPSLLHRFSCVSHTYSSLHSNVCTSFFAVSLDLCPVPNAQSSLNDFVCASISRTFISVLLFGQPPFLGGGRSPSFENSHFLRLEAFWNRQLCFALVLHRC